MGRATAAADAGAGAGRLVATGPGLEPPNAQVAGTNGHPDHHGRAASADDAAALLPAGSIAEAFVGPPQARSDAAFGLSNREREVLGQIVQGRTNREIGERLFISQKTVGVHVGNILSKLGVSGRVEAAMVAVRLDLLPSRSS